MTGSGVDEHAAFESFRAAYAGAQAEGTTADPSLNMLLGLVEPSFAAMIRNLSIPHWFDEELVAVAREPGVTVAAAAIIEDLADLPFVRLHPHGYAYHDIIRLTLRDSVLRQDVARLKRLCCDMSSVLDGRPDERRSEAIAWESVYLMIGCDEANGFARFDTLFRDARLTRRFTVCATLAALLEEQRPLFSTRGQARVDFYRGLNAFDQHLWEEAASLFNRVALQELPVDLANRVRLYRARTLEAREVWPEAKQTYRAHLNRVEGVGGDRGVEARLHQGLARVALRQGDLREAEAEVKRSLELNRLDQDRFGQALNLEVLGQVYAALGDVARASDAFQGSLAMLDTLAREFDKSRIYVNLAQIYGESGQLIEAEHYYRQALDARTAAGDNRGLAFIYASMGVLYAQRGERQTALRYFEASLRGFQQVKDQLNAARILRNIGLTYERIGDLAQAVRHLRQAVDELPAIAELKPAYEREAARLELASRQGHASLRWQFIILLSVTIAAAVFLSLYYMLLFHAFGW